MKNYKTYSLLPTPYSRSSSFSLIIILMQLIPVICFSQKKITSPNSIHPNSQFFIENKGQWPSEVLYLSRNKGLNAWITKHGVTYDFYKIVKSDSKSNSEEKEFNQGIKQEQVTREGQVVQVELEGISGELNAVGTISAGPRMNYFMGSDRSKWVSGAECFSEAVITNTYKGVNTRYYYDKGRIRYDFIVEPGGSAESIKFNIHGADKVYINNEGDLTMSMRYGEIKQAKLFTYQEVKGKKIEVSSKFIDKGNGKYGFELGEYDPSNKVIIDPIVWCTYLGGENNDFGADIVLCESLGAVYVCGGTLSTAFPYTIGAYSNSNAGGRDGYVSKLSIDGTTLLASTYIGGNGDDEFMGIDQNKETNHVFVSGYSKSTNYPEVNSSTGYQGGGDAVVTILDEDLSGPLGGPIYSAYWGSSSAEESSDIQADQTDSHDGFYFCGYGFYNSSLFNTITILTPSSPGAGHLTGWASKISWITPSNSWARYLYGSATSGEQCRGLRLDELGNLFSVGVTYSTDFVNSSTQYYGSSTAGANAFLVQLDVTGALNYQSVVCGAQDEQYFAVDAYDGFAAVIGWTNSSSLPSTVTGNTYSGSTDALVSTFDPSGNLLYNRFLGGTGIDRGRGIRRTNSTIYTIGEGYPNGFPSTQCPAASSGWPEVFVTELDVPMTNVIFSRLIGDAQFQDYGRAIDINSAGEMFITGFTQSPSPPTSTQWLFPVTYGAYDIEYSTSSSSTSGLGDAFVMKLNDEDLNVTCSATSLVVCPGGSTTLIGGGANVYSMNGSPFSATPQVFSPTTTTTYIVVGADALDGYCTASTTITITSGCPCNNAPSGTPIITDPSTSFDFPTGIISTPIIINGTFTVDDPTIFLSNPDVYFLPGARISVNAGETLQIASSTLNGCEVHWDGIYLDGSSGANTLRVSNSTISHMTNGIVATNGAIVQLSANNHFNDNAYQSLYLFNTDIDGTSSYIDYGNTFTTTSSPGLWAPYDALLQQSQHGIVIEDCYQVEIGDPTVSSTNTFEHLNNGIMAIWGTTNTWSTTGVHNNNFREIHDLNAGVTDNDRLNNAFSSANGAGVYGLNSFNTVSGFYELGLTVDNQNTVGPVPVFQDCDKAIAGFNNLVTANDLEIEDCLMGIMESGGTSNSYNLHDNNITDSHIGICVNGPHDNLEINDNNINVTGTVSHPNGVHFPIGIRVNYNFSNVSAPSLSHVYFNNITLDEIAGTGIEFNHVPSSTPVVEQNYVQFTTTSTTALPSGADYNGLYGIRLLNGEETQLVDNRIDGLDGTTNSAAFHARMSYGYYFEGNNSPIIRCNKAKYTAYGFYVRGANLANVESNKMRNNVIPWYFETLTTSSLAEFGTIGSNSVDNTNDFLFGSNSSLTDNVAGVVQSGFPSYYKVYRLDPPATPPFTHEINTISGYLIQAESQGSPSTSKYVVNNYPLATPVSSGCSATGSFKTTSSFININEDQLNHYLDVATENANYVNYPDVGAWMDALKLFRLLDVNEDFMNSNTAFQNFYQANQSTVIGQLVSVDKKIALVKRTGNNITDATNYHEAKMANNNISSNLLYVKKLKEMNAIAIKGLYNGYNTLTAKEKETVQLYAHQCLYSEGDAVLKARDIWTFFNPSEVFDDRAQCVNISNKGDNFDFEGYMSSIRLAGHIGNGQVEGATIYPNPAKGDVTLVCIENGSGQFLLHDASGRLLMSVMLNDQSTNHSIHLPEYLSNGLYTYIYRMNEGSSFTGKLSICK